MSNFINTEEIILFCKKFGIIFQSSEIYGGLNGFFDYGPIGCEIKKNLKNAWWEDMIYKRHDIVGIDSSIIMHPKVFNSSGHISHFLDSMVECKHTNNRYKTDSLFYAELKINNIFFCYITVQESVNMQKIAEQKAIKLTKKYKKLGNLNTLVLKPYDQSSLQEQQLMISPDTYVIGTLTCPKNFNLMFKTYIGANENNNNLTYLRPETAQGIFINFKNIIDTKKPKLPFGIAQIGKSFRNEVNARNFIFRSREFEQMEIEYFFLYKNKSYFEELYNEWINIRFNWLIDIGIDKNKLNKKTYNSNELSHYSKDTTDLMFDFPFGTKELEGISYRGNYDLSQHKKYSNVSLSLFDIDSKKTFIPHVIEPSVGVDRLILALICSNYIYEKERDRYVLKLNSKIAPYKIGILPIVKNNDQIMNISRQLFLTLKKLCLNIILETSGSIGKRYRKMDQIGTPFCVTIDFDTLIDQKITIRQRDTTLQERINISNIKQYFINQFYLFND